MSFLGVDLTQILKGRHASSQLQDPSHTVQGFQFTVCEMSPVFPGGQLSCAVITGREATE